MKKILIASIILLNCGSAMAESNVCNYSMDYNIDINDERVLFNKKSGESYAFKGDQLWINGDLVSLNAKQAKASENLQLSARAMVPKIAEIAIEGAELGVKATSLVLTSLFGNDPDIHRDLLDPINDITQRIKQNISATKLNTENLEKSFDEVFDQEFENMIEKAAGKYSGKFFSNVINSIFSGDSEELKDFEFRMENLGRDIEDYVEANSEKLELKANALCEDMAILDQFDTHLETVNGYPKHGILKQNSDKGFNLSSISIHN